LPTTIDTNVDLRAKIAPVDPRKLKEQYQTLKQSPVTSCTAEVFHFSPPKELSDRERRWLFWGHLASIGVFVREHYVGMNFEGIKDEDFCNATAGLGGQGQFVVFTDHEGTILCMTTGRLYSPNAEGDLNARLRVEFEALAPKNRGNAVNGSQRNFRVAPAGQSAQSFTF
jgi:hypothetical protein